MLTIFPTIICLVLLFFFKMLTLICRKVLKQDSRLILPISWFSFLFKNKLSIEGWLCFLQWSNYKNIFTYNIDLYIDRYNIHPPSRKRMLMFHSFTILHTVYYVVAYILQIDEQYVKWKASFLSCQCFLSFSYLMVWHSASIISYRFVPEQPTLPLSHTPTQSSVGLVQASVINSASSDCLSY